MDEHPPNPYDAEIVDDQQNPTAMVKAPPKRYAGLQPVVNLQVAKKRLEEFQAFVKDYLVPDEDYGTIPGTKKPTLFKPGADKLCELYGLSDSYSFVTKTEDWHADPPLFDYTIRCELRHIETGLLVASGLGSCSSYEGKYRYREATRKCPKCDGEFIIKGKEEYGGGWLCWRKKGGCGATFLEDDEAITKQEAGKVENEDIATLKNTILKMGKKRAKVDATLAATRSSGIFTQDMEDITENPVGSKEAADLVAKNKIAEHEAKKRTPNQQRANEIANAIEAGAQAVSEVVQGKASLKVKWGKLTVYCYNEEWYPWLKKSVGKVCQFTYDDNLRITGIIQIGRRQFNENLPEVDVNEDRANLTF